MATKRFTSNGQSSPISALASSLSPNERHRERDARIRRGEEEQGHRGLELEQDRVLVPLQYLEVGHRLAGLDVGDDALRVGSRYLGESHARAVVRVGCQDPDAHIRMAARDVADPDVLRDRDGDVGSGHRRSFERVRPLPPSCNAERVRLPLSRPARSYVRTSSGERAHEAGPAVEARVPRPLARTGENWMHAGPTVALRRHRGRDPCAPGGRAPRERLG